MYEYPLAPLLAACLKHGGTTLASITIRNLDDVKAQQRLRAAGHGRSMEKEARLILGDAIRDPAVPGDLASIIRTHFVPSNGVELELLPRVLVAGPPSFE